MASGVRGPVNEVGPEAIRRLSGVGYEVFDEPPPRGWLDRLRLRWFLVGGGIMALLCGAAGFGIGLWVGGGW